MEKGLIDKCGYYSHVALPFPVEVRDSVFTVQIAKAKGGREWVSNTVIIT